MMDNDLVASVRITRFDGARRSEEQDGVGVERPLELRVRGRSIVVTLRTPGHDEELAAGYLLAEGLLGCRDDFVGSSPCLQPGRDDRGDVLNLHLSPLAAKRCSRLRGRALSNSSCGLCGKRGLEDMREVSCLRAASNQRCSVSTLTALPDALRRHQEAFLQTGGVHGVALFDFKGRCRVAREDVGRHNAVDKVLGFAFLERLTPLNSHVLLVSGRVSYEIMQKAASAGVPLVAAVSVPSSLAVEMAQEQGQTLVGFLRDGRFNVYADGGHLRWPRAAVKKVECRRAPVRRKAQS